MKKERQQQQQQPPLLLASGGAGENEDENNDENVSLLGCMAHYFWYYYYQGHLPPPPPRAPTALLPDPSSPSYLADLLLHEYNLAGKRRFCYLRCLEEPDRAAFRKKMVHLLQRNCVSRGEQEAIITQGCMHLRTWKEIVLKLPLLACTYKLWRLAFWGENAGGKVTAPIKTNYHVLIAKFEGRPGGDLVNLLITPGQIERVSYMLISPALSEDMDVTARVWDDQVV